MPRAGSATPFPQRIRQATPANRVNMVFNHFDTCSVLTKNQPYAFRLLDTLHSIGEQTQDDRLIRYCRLIRDTYAKNSNLSNAQKAALFLRVGQKATQDDDLQIAAICQHFAGQYYFLNEEYGKAFEHLLAANKAFREIGPERIPELSRYLYELAFNYYYFGDYKKAIELLNESARYPAFSDNLAIQTYNTLGMAYTRLSQPKNPTGLKLAERSYDKARQVAASYNDSLWIGITYAGLADVYKQQRKWGAALAALKIDYAIGLKFGGHRVLPNQTALNIAAIYAQQRQWDSCFYFLQQSMKLYRLNLINPTFVAFGRSLRDEQYLRDYYDVGRKYYQAMNNLPKAYVCMDSLTLLSERINERYESRQISLAEQKLLIQKHQLKVDAMQKEKNTERLLFWIFGVILTLVALLFFLRFRFVRSMRRQDQVINAEKEKSLRLEKHIIEDELHRAKTDLAFFMDNLNEKNTLIDTITAELKALSQSQLKSTERQQFAEAQQTLLNSSLLTNEDWDEFRRRFERVHPSFFVHLKNQFIDISPAEERLLALSKLRVNTRQMSRMLGISTDSIRKAKYRMRKKLGAAGASHLVDLLAEENASSTYA
ncbi:hypothetical protein ACFSUS_20705 [Spirosoma soli]|uniref:Tetratricopeptide repeat protein n=2 Tax=Spirosoma soli TaxID=1770529 RepID=A0ABW5MA30_9BACT